jgi:hypothetical protein
MKLNINKELKKIYEIHWGNLIANANKEDIKAASPLLIKVDEKYENADIKIMICGQETYGWNGSIGDKNIDFLMNDYEAYLYDNQDYFNTNVNYKNDEYSKNERLKKKNKRIFWNNANFKYFEEKLTEHFGKKNKKTAFIWNNLSKIGNSKEYKNGKGKPSKKVVELEKKYFNVFKKEVEILKPNIIIFTTGKRDYLINDIFGGDVKFLPKLRLEIQEPLRATTNLIAEVILPEFKNIFSVRVEHPSRRALDKSIVVDIIKEIYKNQI